MDAEESFCKMEPTIPNVGSDDEESFVVLGTSSFNEEDIEDTLNGEVLPPIRAGKIHEMQNLIKMEISQINTSTAIPEMPVAEDINTITTSVTSINLSSNSSHEEIQKKVEEVIRENEKLKNVIAQNNVSMKAHYDKILAWKDEVNKVVKFNKDRFLEAKTYIEKYKEENNKLSNDVEKYKKIKELQDEEIMNLKSKEKEFLNMGPLPINSDRNLMELQCQAANKKVEDIKAELDEANRKQAELMAENEKLKQQLTSTPGGKDPDTHQLQLMVEAGRDEIMKLRSAMEDMQQQMELEKNKLLAEIERLTQKLVKTPNADDQLQAKSREIEQLRQENQASNDQIIKLRNERDGLARELVVEKRKYKLTETSMSNIKASELEIFNLQQENKALQEKDSQLQVQLTQTQKQVVALEEENQKKVKDIEELRELLQNAKTDEIFALNAQLTLFKTDFEAERESKQAIKQERDQIAEDLKNLQKRNKQLQNEIEVMRARTQQSSKTDDYVCPKCSFAFRNYQSLENHVHKCLDLESFP